MKGFLYLPFKETCDFKITEGWLYSEAEKNIHGHTLHKGVDFAMPRRSSVLAAASGYALSSYHTGFDGEFEERKVGYGLGKFVQIWHPGANVYTIYVHLEEVNRNIPFLEPVKSGGCWDSPWASRPLSEILWHSKFVVRGEEIGLVGDSGLSRGYAEGPDFRPDPETFPSLDEAHLHFVVLKRDDAGKKEEELDPFGHYGDFRVYQSLKPAKDSLWLLDRSGLPRFASRS